MDATLALLLLPTLCLQLDPLAPVDSWTDNLRSPARIAVASDGTVLVSDPFYDHIARFDGVGAPLVPPWPVPEGPIGIAAHPDGRHFVSWRDLPKVGIYEIIGSVFSRTGFLGEGNPPVTFVGPTDIGVHEGTGRIFVVDSADDQIYAFESNGDLAWATGIRGELSGEFQYPSAIGVDEAAGRLIIADQDNFRLQIFGTDGIFQQLFGYRLKYLPDWFQEGWTPRTLGVAVDAESRIYVADALMSTVRIFDPTGVELGKVVVYGSAPGDVRTPTDLALSSDGTQLYVVSTNTSSVEVYATPDFTARAVSDGDTALEYDALTGKRGTNACEYDEVYWRLLTERSKGTATGNAGRKRDGSVGRELTPDSTPGADESGGTRQQPGFDGPHMIEAMVICGRCHGVIGQPGSHPGTVEGQSTLCMSCHNTAGQAMHNAVHELDMADPFGTNPNAADRRGRSHAWGVPAINAQADSVGAAPGSDMELHIDPAGNMKCSTCHNQHTSDADAPYLRVLNDGDAMCKECHAPRNEGLGERGTHPVGFDYPGETGEFPTDDQLSPLVLREDLVECMTCHAPHFADSGGANDGEGDGMLLRAGNDGTLCRTCHTEHEIHDVGGDWQPTCTDCHDLHDPDSENLSLVARDVNDTAMTFQDNDLGANNLHDLIHSNNDPATYDGMCEVCHTETGHHRNSADGDHAHYAGMLCTECHTHDAGFMLTGGSCTACHGQPPDGEAYPNTAGSHATHMSGANGPGITDCFLCHSTFGGGTHSNGSASFTTGVDGNADGNIDLSETDVCDACHSPDGPFDGVAEGKSNWATGSPVSCEGCHDSGNSTIQGVSAPPVAGDNVSSGYFAVGHGRNGSVGCVDCHDVSAPHFDGLARTYAFNAAYYGAGESGVAYASGYRLQYVDGEVPLMIPANYNITFGYNAGLMKATAFRLCFQCHDPSAVLDDTPGDGIDSNFKASLPNPPRDYSYAWGSGADINEHVAHIMNYAGPFADSDWDTGTVGPGGTNGYDTMTACSNCHNVHGAAGAEGSTNEPMIRDGSLVGRSGYGFSYVVEDVGSGGYPMVTSTGAAQSTSVGAIFRNNTANMCGGSMCHGDPAPPPGSSYDASGSSWGTYLEYYRP